MTENNNSALGLIIVLCVAIMLVILSIAAAMVWVAGAVGDTVASVTPAVTPTPVPVYATTSSTLLFTALKASAAQPNAASQLDRYYSVLTTDGDILIFPNFYSWDIIIPQQSYTCTITSLKNNYGRNIYSASGCNLYRYSEHAVILYNTNEGYHYYNSNDNYYAQYPYDNYHYYNRNDGTFNNRYPPIGVSRSYQYYHYNNQYWRCEGSTCDTISITGVPAYVTIFEYAPPGYHYSRY